MRLLPENLDNVDIPPDAKRCLQALRKRLPDDYTGIIGVNLTQNKGDNYTALFGPEGLVLLRFFDLNDIALQLSILCQVYPVMQEALFMRLNSHAVLKNPDQTLIFPVRMLFVFTGVEELPSLQTVSDQAAAKNFRVRGWLSELRRDAQEEIRRELTGATNSFCLPDNGLTQDVINVAINRIAPWCTIPKLPALPFGEESVPVRKALQVERGNLGKGDSLIEVMRLDPEQVEMVNAIRPGHQLILACAGSGKSVIMIARCFKLASLDRDRRYLITCYNKNLQQYYDWQIDEAGFHERNVDCFTFHGLCRRLLMENGLPVPHNQFSDEGTVAAACQALEQRRIKNRYYGIFIDEVQNFKPEWYRFCYGLLEHPESDEHVLAICGDITQDVKKNIKRGKAPWQGEGLPSYSGNTRHIEKNYRNTVEINEFINVYADLTREQLKALENAVTPETFLRGTAFRRGRRPELRMFKDAFNPTHAEAKAIAEALRNMYISDHIGFTDMAVLLCDRYAGIPCPKGQSNLLVCLEEYLRNAGIPYVKLAWRDGDEEYVTYQSRNGVSLITYEGVLGLDYRGIVVANVSRVGARESVAKDDVKSIARKSEDEQEEFIGGFKALYTACTRARDRLTVVLPDRETFESTYTDILFRTFDKYGRDA